MRSTEASQPDVSQLGASAAGSSAGAGSEPRASKIGRMPGEAAPAADVSLEGRIRDHGWAIGRIQRQLGPRLGRLVEAEDVLQEVLVIAVRHRATVETLDPPQFRAWIHRVALRRILLIARDMRTRTRPRRETSLPPSHVTPMDAAALDGVAPKKRRGQGQRDNPIIAPLGELMGESKRVLWLRDNFTLDWLTVSFLLWRTREASRQLHYRARKCLA